MRHCPSRLAVLLMTICLLCAGSAFGAAKKYQVTGKVLAFNDKTITVEKGDEKWELDRTADTKITGTLKVGEKVTIEYKMIAQDIEVK